MDNDHNDIEIFFDDIKKDVPGWWEFRTNLGEIRDELELDPPLMPPEETIDEVSKILTITGFKDKIEKIRASQEFSTSSHLEQ